MENDIKGVLRRRRAIWGEERLPLKDVIVRLGVSIGDLCRWTRNSEKDASTRTAAAQKRFAAANSRR